MIQSNVMYILSNGRVAAINKKSGEIIWDVKLKKYLKSKFSLSFGQLSVEDHKLYVGASGILICLHTSDGSLIWKNELKGWGYNFISMANVSNEAAAAASLNNAAAATIVATTAG